ncbi:MAG: DUF4040 domain-containing protein [Candidatus Cloacimonetes bacterium]|nr:DUF4040 domain-containing protein [Candidatus Cloacimonadota bacterium]
MELYLIIMLALMILGSIYSLHAKDLLSAVVSYGIVGFALVISFLLLQAPDLAIVQVVVEIITLIIMIAVITNTTHETESKKLGLGAIFYSVSVLLFVTVALLFMSRFAFVLNSFGQHVTRMADNYVGSVAETGSANIITGIIFHFRAYDTLGEATVLFTAVIGVICILRHEELKAPDAVKIDVIQTMPKGMTLVVKNICQFLAPVIFLFGAYVAIHGHLSPGGGFTGGVIMASAFIFQILAGGSVLDKLRKEKWRLELSESVAIFSFLLLAVLGLLIASALVFFANFLPTGNIGELVSGGIIPIGNVIIGIEVCAAISSIFVALLIYKDEELG